MASINQAGSFLEPSAIRLEYAHQCVQMVSEIEKTVGWEYVDFAELAWKLGARCVANQYGHETFVSLRNFIEFPVHPFRMDRSIADQPYHGIGLADEFGKLCLPLLAELKITAVNQYIEATLGQCVDDGVG